MAMVAPGLSLCPNSIIPLFRLLARPLNPLSRPRSRSRVRSLPLLLSLLSVSSHITQFLSPSICRFHNVRSHLYVRESARARVTRASRLQEVSTETLSKCQKSRMHVSKEAILVFKEPYLCIKAYTYVLKCKLYESQASTTAERRSERVPEQSGRTCMSAGGGQYVLVSKSIHLHICT
jgi:hypothetical protein